MIWFNRGWQGAASKTCSVKIYIIVSIHETGLASKFIERYYQSFNYWNKSLAPKYSAYRYCLLWTLFAIKYINMLIILTFNWCVFVCISTMSSSTKVDQKSRKGLIGVAIFGGLATGIVAVALPFVWPAFRKIVLPYLKHKRPHLKESPEKDGIRLIDLGSGDGRIVNINSNINYWVAVTRWLESLIESTQIFIYPCIDCLSHRWLNAQDTECGHMAWNWIHGSE